MASRGSLAVAAGGIASLVLVPVITLVLAARSDDPALGPEVVVTGTTPADRATATPEPSLKPHKTTKPDTDTVSPVQPPPPVPGGGEDDDGGDDDDD
ncbi:hypothetical protein [Actinocorallia libanotica]|uniref:Small secreted hydrophilic protein n=1 Tax=Actinocorallia libanotica TaxID=46162 RepID=A0ABN1RVL0_9ACTN